MNRYTIIVDDQRVAVDAVGYDELVFQIDPSIHAVQWYGTYGEIEYKTVFDPVTKTVSKPQNEIFENATRFQNALDAWQVADIQAKEAQQAVVNPPEASSNGGV